MFKKLFKNSSIYLLSNIINSAIPFLLLPLLTRYLSPEEYGIISMFTLIVTIVLPIIGLNVNSSIMRNYYDDKKTNIKEYTYNCILIVIINTIIIGIIFTLFSGIISQITYIPSKYLWTIIVYTFCQFISLILLTIWQVEKKVVWYGIFNNSRTLINVGLSLIFIIILNMNWLGRIYGQLIAMVIFAVISIFILFKRNYIKVAFNINYIKSALLFGAPLVFHSLSGSILSIIDRLFITNMISISANGIYSVGYQIGVIINLLAISFNNAFVPWLFENLKKNKIDIKLKIIKFTYLYFIIILALAIILGLIAPYLFKVIIGNEFNESNVYVIWIAIGYAFNGMYFMVVNYIFYAKKTNILIFVTVITAIINVILNYYFIKKFGAIGAAQATAIVFGIKFILVWILASKVYKMPWRLKNINLKGCEQND